MPARDRITKSYIDTPDGQVHLRIAGAGGRVVLMVHWTPLTGRLYAGIAEILAAAGFRVIMPDLLGYGRSDPRPDPWSMAAYADNLLNLLKGLNVTQCVVLGGHNGASIAIEMALQSAVVRGVILDGLPVLTPELRAAFANLRESPRPSVKEDGSHATLAWDRTVGLLKMYIPGFEVSDVTLDMVHLTLKDYLETDFVTAGAVAASFDAEIELPKVNQPIFLLGAELETLAASFPIAQALRPEAKGHFFKGHHPLLMQGREVEYVEAILPFLEAHA